MATDVDVQFFSHLNGLVLSNNWGDMIRLLDTCLVNGLPLPSVTSASVDTQGDITLNLYADHKSLLFQIVELSGFEPVEINGKYRIKGAPSTTKLILKATHVGKTVTKIGTAKLASLGYDIVFRDSTNVKRAYRAKNPRTEHPFIRVDETISDGTNSYTSTYAKSAMVGLIENMTHIDDYQDTSKLQLPLDTTDFSKNWKISGNGTSCVRGWMKWHYAYYRDPADSGQEDYGAEDGNRAFTITGDADAFYLLHTRTNNSIYKFLHGCGLFESNIAGDTKNWFLMATDQAVSAGTNYSPLSSIAGGTPLMYSEISSGFFVAKFNSTNNVNLHVRALPLLPDLQSGYTNIYAANNLSALQVPFSDSDKYLRGNLKHACYAGKKMTSNTFSTPLLSENSMYVYDSAGTNYGGQQVGGLLFYLGELE